MACGVALTSALTSGRSAILAPVANDPETFRALASALRLSVDTPDATDNERLQHRAALAAIAAMEETYKGLATFARVALEEAVAKAAVGLAADLQLPASTRHALMSALEETAPAIRRASNEVETTDEASFSAITQAYARLLDLVAETVPRSWATEPGGTQQGG